MKLLIDGSPEEIVALLCLLRHEVADQWFSALSTEENSPSGAETPAQWTAEILGEMHLSGVTAKQLAAEVGWHDKYLSAVMNGHREPKDAERKLREALHRLKERKTTT